MRKTAAITAVVAAAGLTAGAAVQSTVKDKVKVAPDKNRQVRVIERVGPGPWSFANFGGGPRLGVALREVTGDTPQAAAGAVVAEVEGDSPAAKAGLKSGDVIVEFDGERVRGVRQLQRLVNETPAGRPVKLGVSRDGKRVELSTTLEERDRPDVIGFDKQKLEQDIQRGVEEGMRGMREFHFELPDKQAPGDVIPKEPGERWNFRVEPRWPMFQWSEGAGRLGVMVQELGEQLRDHFGASNGVLVASVSPESAAARAGLKAGDVITTVAGKKVETTDDLVRGVRAADDGAEVEIGIVRDKKGQTLKVKLSDGGRARKTWTI
jgi:serine protease Do